MNRSNGVDIVVGVLLVLDGGIRCIYSARMHIAQIEGNSTQREDPQIGRLATGSQACSLLSQGPHLD